jgi:hypothetical protein
LKLFLLAVATIGVPLWAHVDVRGDRVILAQASPPEVCTEIYQPVCGTDPNGRRVTYSNACFARIARAIGVTQGECPK